MAKIKVAFKDNPQKTREYDVDWYNKNRKDLKNWIPVGEVAEVPAPTPARQPMPEPEIIVVGGETEGAASETDPQPVPVDISGNVATTKANLKDATPEALKWAYEAESARDEPRKSVLDFINLKLAK